MDVRNVAVYGTLREGQYNAHWLDDVGEYKGTLRIPDWEMYTYGPYPFVSPKEEGSIIVEVYALNDGGIEHLDMLEGYPDFYNRTVIDTELGSAWLYYIIEDGEYPTVLNGDWVEACNE